MNNSLTLTSVFEAKALGYLQTRIPALVITAKGTLLAFCEGRRGRGDWVEIDILIRRSTDGGETWSDVEVLVKSSGEPISNSTPIACADGSVHFLHVNTYKKCYYLRSDDDGISWSTPRDITPVFEEFRPEYDWEVIAPGPGHGVELSSGRMVVPLWLCDPARGEIPGGDHRPSCVATIYSDDKGATWKRGDIVIQTTEEYLHPSENAAAELSDGCVMINARSETACHRRLVTTSPDGVTHWTKAVFDENLYDPVCMGSLLSMKDPRDGSHVLLFCNPDSYRQDPTEHNRVHFCARVNGTIKLSRDDGKTWSDWRVIEAGPFSYNDIAAASDGTIYCLYESGIWGKPAHHTNTHIGLAKFSLEWIEKNPAKSYL